MTQSAGNRSRRMSSKSMIINQQTFNYTQGTCGIRSQRIEIRIKCRLGTLIIQYGDYQIRDRNQLRIMQPPYYRFIMRLILQGIQKLKHMKSYCKVNNLLQISFKATLQKNLNQRAILLKGLVQKLLLLQTQQQNLSILSEFLRDLTLIRCSNNCSKNLQASTRNKA